MTTTAIKTASAGARSRRTAAFDAAVVLTIMVIVVIARRPLAHLVFPINPDEAQAVANTLRLGVDAMTWRSVDGGSNGPLNFFVLMWPRLFGLPVTLGSARITAALLVGLTIASLYVSARTFAPARLVLPVILVATAFEATTGFFDFAHYSSEILPNALLALALACAMLGLTRRSTMPLLIAACLLGAVPFAKLQATIVALPLGIALLVAAVRLGGPTVWLRTAAVVVAATIPAAVILVPLAAAGEIEAFWNSYVAWSVIYASSNVMADTAAPILPNLLHLFAVSLQATSFGWMFYALLAMALVAMISSSGTGERRSPEQQFYWLVAIATVMAAVVAIATPARPFYHYVRFVFVGAGAAALALVPLARTSRLGLPMVWAIALVASGIVAFQGRGEGLWKLDAHDYPGRVAASPFMHNDLLGFVAEPSDRLLVWGWMPEYHAYSGLVPATRETVAINQITGLPYFRERMLRDLDRTPATIVVDAVAPSSFYFTDRATQGLTSFPALAERIAREHVLINPEAERAGCPAIHLARERVTAFEARTVRPHAVRDSGPPRRTNAPHSPSRAFDRSVFDTCDDFWLLPEPVPGYLEADFAPTALASVSVLATAGPGGATGVERIRVTAFAGETQVHETEVPLRRWPAWTRVPLPNVTAERLRITIDSVSGPGSPGLNEVVISRARP